MGRPLHRRSPPRGAGVDISQEAPRRADVRVGSVTDGLTPISAVSRSLAAGPAQWLALASVVATALVADQLTKQIVRSELALGDAVEIAGPFTLHHVQNTGIAFGLFASATPVVILVTGIAVLWMVAYFARSGARHPILPVGLGLVIGGSVSNLADRIRLGHVTDFLDLGFWPAFNLADTFIVVGVSLLLGALAAADREPRRSRRAADASHDGS